MKDQHKSKEHLGNELVRVRERIDEFEGREIERRRSEEMLRESETRFSNMVEKNADAIVVINPDGIVHFVNPAAEVLLNRKVHELINKHFGFPVAVGETTELTVFGKGGKRTTAEMHVVEIPWDGEIEYLASLRDISDRNQAEKALQESNERYRDLYENAPNAYFSISAVDGSILECNSEASRLLGYEKETLMKMEVFDLYADTPHGLTKAQKVFGCFKEGESIKGVELEMKHKDGHPVWVSVSVEPVKDRDGNMIESRSIVIDISERKDLEEKFLWSQRMEAVGRLASGVAHDFNNILTTIIGRSDIVSMTHRKNHALLKEVEEIKKAANRAASLTGQLLAFSRKQILQPKVLDLNRVIESMEDMIRRLMAEDIELRVITPQDLGRVKVDPGQMEQVVMNLAVNARDAMAHGGKLTIETAEVDLDEAYGRKEFVVQPGLYVMLTVSDTGTGMDRETQSKMFEPFFTTKEKGEGSGLGLATVYGIIKQSNGYIWVNSEPGQGTTFKIYLPKVEEEADPVQEQPVLKDAVQGTETVLVVEDNEMVRELAGSILERYGYRVLAAKDAEEALNISEQHQGSIHLMLTDVVMPRMSGRELAEQLSSMRRKVKVLFMSGYTGETVVRHGVSEEESIFLQKPFTADNLAQKVREILDH